MQDGHSALGLDGLHVGQPGGDYFEGEEAEAQHACDRVGYEDSVLLQSLLEVGTVDVLRHVKYKADYTIFSRVLDTVNSNKQIKIFISSPLSLRLS